MSFKLKLNLWKHKADKDGLCPVAISIRGGGQETYYNTKVKVLPDNWKDGLITKADTKYKYKNARLQTMVQDAERDMLTMEMNGTEFTIEDIKNLFHPTIKSGSFTKFYRAYIDNLIATKKKAYATIQMWETEYRHFSEFAGDLPHSRVTTDLLNRYNASLSKYSRVTVKKKLKKLRQIIGNAIKEGHIQHKQIAGFEMPQVKEVQKDYLTLEQTEKIANAIYDGTFDVDYTIKKVACYFLIGCYSGLRISDWRRFKVEKLVNGESLKVSAQKNKEPIYIPLNVFTRLGKIVKYVQDNNIQFDIVDQVANRVLKFVGGHPDIKIPFAITCHTSRHTAATLLGEMGYSAFAISQILGITERTAQIYRKATRKGLENEYNIIGGL